MRRTIVAGLAAFALAAPGFALAPASYEDVFVGLVATIDAGIEGIPDPPVEKQDKKDLKAWNAAKKVADKAVTKPSPKGFTKASGKIEKILRKAFPEDPTVDTALSDFAADTVAATYGVLVELQNEIDALPPGDDREFLEALLADTQALLDAAGAEIPPSEAHSLCAQAAKILATVEKKYNKAIAKAVGERGMTAVIDDDILVPGTTAFSTSIVDGGIVTVEGQPRTLGIAGIVISGTNTESITLGIDLLDAGTPIVPGTYTLESFLAEGGYFRGGGETIEEAITGQAGSITIVSINAANGSVSGFFEFTGPNFTEGTGSITSGTFNATNLVVTPAE